MATVDYFLKIDGIEGESTDGKHKNEIELQSWSWGATQFATFGSGGGGGAGKVDLQNLSFTSTMSKASPKLMLFCANGMHVKSATLVARKAGGKQEEYYKVTLSDVLVTGYQTGASGVTPVDQVSLASAKIEIEYKPQKADGSLDAPVKAGYDLSKNEKV